MRQHPNAPRLNDDVGGSKGDAPAAPPANDTAGAAPAAAAGAPLIRALDRAGCEAILARNQVGRLAFALHDRVDIEPLHYVYDGGWVYARTAAGHKITTLAHNRWVAFEVDEVEAVFRWRSVVVHGAVHLLDPDGAPRDRAAWERGVELLRRVVPEAGTADDPVPHRSIVFRIYLDDVSGREATPEATAP